MFFFVFNFIFKITTKFLLFWLKFFPGILYLSMQLQFMPSTGKYSKKPKSPSTNFLDAMRQKTFNKNLDWNSSLLPHGFWYQKHSETPKGPSRVFLQDKKFWTIFCKTPSMVQQFFATDKGTALEISGNTINFQKYKRARLLCSQYRNTAGQKIFDVFWWFTNTIYWNFCVGEMSSVDFDVFKVCSSFLP